ncbi:serine-enriched protein-like [Liolophura sinensis]|uniref:serine-enriched protein-like n=1 Tax=Liolophura sinensis TaxID=3198878 RepID=UPI00315986DE
MIRIASTGTSRAHISHEPRMYMNQSKSKPDSMQFKNTKQICDGLRLILGMPEMCDVKFLVGENQTPVYAVKAILATRSRIFYNMIRSHKYITDAKASIPAKKAKGFVAKLRRLTKRGLEPLKKSSKKSTASPIEPSTLVIPITDFELDIFQRVILYMHSGSVNVDVSSVIGVMTAADVYGISNLRKACLQLAARFITMKTVLQLLASSEPYMSFRCITSLLNKILAFIAARADDILVQPDFEHLPKAAVKAVLFRPDLQTTEERKWDAAVQWSRQHCNLKEISVFRETIGTFVPHINFVKISWSKLNREILPMNILPEEELSRVMITCCPPPKPPRQRRSL